MTIRSGSSNKSGFNQPKPPMASAEPDAAVPTPSSFSKLPTEVLQLIFCLTEDPASLACVNKACTEISVDPLVRASWTRRTMRTVFRSAGGKSPVQIPNSFLWAIGFYEYRTSTSNDDAFSASPTSPTPQSKLTTSYKKKPQLHRLQTIASSIMNSEVARILLLARLPKHLASGGPPWGRIAVIPRYQIQRVTRYLFQVIDRSDLLQVAITYGHAVYGERYLELNSDDVRDFHVAVRQLDEPKIRQLVERDGVLVGNDHMVVEGLLSLADPLVSRTLGNVDPFTKPEAQTRIDLIKYLARRAVPHVSSTFLSSVLSLSSNSRLLFSLCDRRPRIAVDPGHDDGKLLVDAAAENCMELIGYLMEISDSKTLDEPYKPPSDDEEEAENGQTLSPPSNRQRKNSLATVKEPPPQHVKSWNRDTYTIIHSIPLWRKRVALQVARSNMSDEMEPVPKAIVDRLLEDPELAAAVGETGKTDGDAG